ncbi:MAG: hypothetical protein ABEJ65_11545 [bacterium]
MRVLSITEWHHFAYMVISLALLGFGAGGTAVSQFSDWIDGSEWVVIRFSLIGLGFSIFGARWLGQIIPFETFELTQSPRQFLYLLLVYILYAIPFLFISVVVAIGFNVVEERVGIVYGLNMAGSGLGAAIIVYLIYHVSPINLITWLLVPVYLALLFSIRWEVKPVLFSFLAGLVLLFTIVIVDLPTMNISPYKPLSYILNSGQANVVTEDQSPLSYVHAVRSSLIRETPGQVSNYPYREKGPLPDQVGLYFDGEGPSVINHINSGDSLTKQVPYLDYVTTALPYRVVRPDSVLIIGPGGGTPILNALMHGSKTVTGIEMDPAVIELMRGRFRQFSGDLYGRNRVNIVHSTGRSYLDYNRDRYDLVNLGVVGGLTGSLSGAKGTTEDFSLTVEAIELYLRRIEQDGAISISRWLRTPARDGIKTFALLVEGARKYGLSNPSRHLLVIRSWNSATYVLTRSPVSQRQIKELKTFAENRWFDLVYYPGISRSETNQFIELEVPIYNLSARKILSGKRQNFYREYPFYVRPATDDRPYSSRYFKWSTYDFLRRNYGNKWYRKVSWGYLVLWVTLLQGIVVSVPLVGLPLVGSRSLKGEFSYLFLIFMYFGGIGLGYMFIEISFIQGLMRILQYPIYSISVVITGFLLSSGMGSYTTSYFNLNPTWIGMSVGFIAVYLMVCIFFLPPVLTLTGGLPVILRILLSLLIIFPVAFVMGFPFAMGLQYIRIDRPGAVPWAWAINGCLSVTGAVMARLFLVHFGFNFTLLMGIFCYLMAGLAVVVPTTFVIKKIQYT